MKLASDALQDLGLKDRLKLKPSLLSGGEKALTAISLLFAVFLSNPSPLCILDEVDAPLDDTNVARFCDLLDEIKSSTNTRFMIITHHRLTMARMDLSLIHI